MALIKFGGGVLGMSGSIGGNTFARNRSGSYVRTRTIPTNPNSEKQQLIRNAVKFITQYWKDTLTDAKRLAWKNYADAVNWLNPLGESTKLSGFNMFVRSNSLLKFLNLAIVEDGPATLSLPEVDPTIAATITTAAGISLAFDNTQAWANEDNGKMVVFMGQPVNKTKNYFGGPWKYVGKIDGDADTAPTSPTVFASLPYNTEIGQKVWVKCRIIRADGRLSTEFRAAPVVIPS